MTYRPPAIHPESLGIYQERMPLYINCSEVTHIYTNGSYQLIYQNSTPLFVQSKQVKSDDVLMKIGRVCVEPFISLVA